MNGFGYGVAVPKNFLSGDKTRKIWNAAIQDNPVDEDDQQDQTNAISTKFEFPSANETTKLQKENRKPSRVMAFTGQIANMSQVSSISNLMSSSVGATIDDSPYFYTSVSWTPSEVATYDVSISNIITSWPLSSKYEQGDEIDMIAVDIRLKWLVYFSILIIFVGVLFATYAHSGMAVISMLLVAIIFSFTLFVIRRVSGIDIINPAFSIMITFGSFVLLLTTVLTLV